MTLNISQTEPLLRSRTEQRIAVSGNGLRSNSEERESSPHVLERARTEILSPSHQNGCEFDVDRVLYEISRKVNNNKKSLLYLFRNNDPSGRGAISREALHRIMRVLYGFLTSDQFNKLLRRLNIHNRSQVTYDVFMACFEDAEAMQKKYLRKQLLEPFWRAASASSDTRIELIENNDERRYNDVATGMEKGKALDDRTSVLRKRLFDALPKIKASFSETTSTDTLLTSKLLRNVLDKSGITLAVEDANVLWDKLDLARCGFVPLRRFYTFVDPLFDAQKPVTAPNGTRNPAPNMSNVVPRLTVRRKQEANRKFTPYQYPVEHTEDIVKQSDAKFVRQSLPEINKIQSINSFYPKSFASTKKPFSIDNDKSALEQIVNRMVEPRERFMNFCRRFDDDNGGGKIALGQLLGCLLFCGKTVPENSVNQLLQKIGVKSNCMEESFENGKSYDYKLLGCCIYDIENNRILANILSSPEKYFRHIREAANEDWCESDSSSYDILEAKFLKMMYNDIIKLVTELRRVDRANTGLISEKDFEIAISRVFKTTFTRRQLSELTQGAIIDDGSGGIVIANFIKSMFSSAQPDVCRTLSMPPKRQVKARGSQGAENDFAQSNSTVLTEEDEQQKQLQQQLLDGSSFGIATEMTEKQAVDLFKQVMKDRFHAFDKQFVALDVKQTKRISSVQLHIILRNMNIHLNMKELGYMWKYVPVDADGLCSYRRFLLHFVSGQNQVTSNKIINKENQNGQEGNAEISLPKTEGEQEIAKVEKKMVDVEMDEVLECIRLDVCRQWGVLKERIRQEDGTGTGQFDSERLNAVFKGAGMDVTNEALKHITRKYTSVVQNKRRFFYMPFMKYFTKRFTNRQTLPPVKPSSNSNGDGH